MQLAGLSSLSAPQVTGHPLGLPGAPDKKPSITEVKPILDARRPETQLGNGSPRGFYYAVQGEVDPVDHNPPPSIMQIKISQILQDQALGMPKEETSATPDATANFDDAPQDVYTSGDETATEEPSQRIPAERAGQILGQISGQNSGQNSGQPPAESARAAPPQRVKPKADPVPERAPMSMPIKAETPVKPQSPTAAQAPAAYEEAAAISRRDLLSTLA